MGIATKNGGGGNVQEAYNTDDGKYVAKSGVNKDEIRDAILAGMFDSPDMNASDIFKTASDEERDQIIEAISSLLNEQETSTEMEERYQAGTSDEFTDWGKQCDSKFDQDTLNGFYSGYMGAGDEAFEFNKALRLGFNKFYGLYPSYKTHYNLNQIAIEERAAKLDKLTHGFKMPRDCQVYRYVDENYLVSQFRDYLGDFESKIKMGKFGYEEISRDDISIDDMYNNLSQAVGQKVASDNGFTSFSVVPKQTHMGNHSDKNKYKRIHILYDVPKDTDCYISQYQRESEGVFPRNTKFFLKDVQKKVGDDGNERVVLYYGISKQ